MAYILDRILSQKAVLLVVFFIMAMGVIWMNIHGVEANEAFMILLGALIAKFLEKE